MLLEHPAKEDSAVVEIGGSVLSSNGIDGVTGLQNNTGSHIDPPAKNDTTVIETAFNEVASNGVDENSSSKKLPIIRAVLQVRRSLLHLLRHPNRP